MESGQLVSQEPPELRGYAPGPALPATPPKTLNCVIYADFG